MMRLKIQSTAKTIKFEQDLVDALEAKCAANGESFSLTVKKLLREKLSEDTAVQKLTEEVGMLRGLVREFAETNLKMQYLNLPLMKSLYKLKDINFEKMSGRVDKKVQAILSKHDAKDLSKGLEDL